MAQNKITSKIVNIDGTPMKMEIQENAEFKEDTPGLSYLEWAAVTPLITPIKAWNYKQGEIQCLLDEWNESVLYGKDKLKESIEAMTKLNNKLKGENAQLRKELAESMESGNNFI